MKVAIFGGSFNPVHNEHINIVKEAIKSLNLDKVIIMPSNITPAKVGRMFANNADRLNMCKLAFGDISKAEVSDFEILQGGISYSYITCQEFKNRYPHDERYFIVGGDMLESFSQWKKPEEILSCVTLAVCARENKQKLERAEADFCARFGNSVAKFGYVGKNISSTRIRALAALGESLAGLVDSRVQAYIKAHSLYLIDGAEKVKASLSEYRWKHTVGVAACAAENCSYYGVSERDAVTAALFHDCGKELAPDSKLISDCPLPADVPSPVVHQFTGAYLAEHLYGIKDKAIINAVKYHCSGRAAMSPFEKLIYLSDMVEEGRNYEGVDELRAAFKSDKDKAFILALKRHMNHLKTSGFPVYSLTKKAYEYYSKEHKNDE